MKRFQDLPIQGKLTVAMLLMLGIVLVLVGVAVSAYESAALRQAGVADLSSLAHYHSRLRDYTLMIVGIAALSVLVVMLIVTKVQRSIAGPIAETLNLGLAQVEERERALQQRSHELQQELVERHAAEHERERLLGELRKANAGLRHLAQRVLTAHEDERRRISRELHDEAGQALIALKIWLVALGEDLPAEAAALRQRLTEAARLTDDTMNHIRTLAQDLRPPALETLPLDACLKGYCREFGQRIALPVEYRSDELPKLPEALNICLYRVVQEALTNVAKHARATRVGVELRHHKGIVSLSVFDDGQGFTAPAGHPAGIGLLGMQERLELLGGRMEITSQPGRGTQLVVYIPMEREP